MEKNANHCKVIASLLLLAAWMLIAEQSTFAHTHAPTANVLHQHLISNGTGVVAGDENTNAPHKHLILSKEAVALARAKVLAALRKENKDKFLVVLKAGALGETVFSAAIQDEGGPACFICDCTQGFWHWFMCNFSGGADCDYPLIHNCNWV